MPVVQSIVREYQKTGTIGVLRLLLYKEFEKRNRFMRELRSWYNLQLFSHKIPNIGKGFKIGADRVNIILGDKGEIIIGDDVTIYTPIEMTSTTHIFARTLITIGDRTRIGSYTSLRSAKKISIGKDCLIAQWVRIYDYNGHSVAPGNYENMDTLRNRSKTPPDEVGEITIGDNVWIGENSFIQRGVNIGDNSIVSANSVVVKNVPPNVVVFGAPARVILWLDRSKELSATEAGTEPKI